MATSITLTTNSASTDYTLAAGARGPVGPTGPEPDSTDNAFSNPGMVIKSAANGSATFGNHVTAKSQNVMAYVSAEVASHPDSSASLVVLGNGTASLYLGSNATGGANILADNVSTYVDLQLPNASGTLALTSDVPTGNATHTGDVTGATALTLATVNSNVGTFTNATVAVNAKGLVTAASSGPAPVTSVTGTANQITVTGTTQPTISLPTTITGLASVTSTTFVGALTGNATTSSSTTGNAATVTGLSITAGKTLSATNTLTLSGTDGSTLGIGTGGTLGTLAYQSGTFSGVSSGTNTGDETAARIAAALNAGTQDATAADTDRLAVTSPAGGWMLLSTIWTWIKTKLSTSGDTITVNGPLILSSATRPTSSAALDPAATTSLITLADANARMAPLFGFAQSSTLTTGTHGLLYFGSYGITNAGNRVFGEWVANLPAYSSLMLNPVIDVSNQENWRGGEFAFLPLLDSGSVNFTGLGHLTSAGQRYTYQGGSFIITTALLSFTTSGNVTVVAGDTITDAAGGSAVVQVGSTGTTVTLAYMNGTRNFTTGSTVSVNGVAAGVTVATVTGTQVASGSTSFVLVHGGYTSGSTRTWVVWNNTSAARAVRFTFKR